MRSPWAHATKPLYYMAQQIKHHESYFLIVRVFCPYTRTSQATLLWEKNKQMNIHINWNINLMNYTQLLCHEITWIVKNLHGYPVGSQYKDVLQV